MRRRRPAGAKNSAAASRRAHVRSAARSERARRTVSTFVTPAADWRRMASVMTNELPAARLLVCWCWLVLLGGGPLAAGLRAQLVPKGITGAAKAATPTRPEGTWKGTARETIADGSVLEYAIDLAFTGTDDALQLVVSGTAKVPADGQTLTVSIRARYAGTFRDTKLAMRSEQIDVRVVETGQDVPSAPQRVEATLQDGVLQGRVGGDDEGWTTFTAKKPGTDRNAPPAAATFAGRWRGTSREPGPDGRELEYPVTVELRGDAADLRADVSADVKYPTEDGGTTPVEYRATFRGRAVDGELQLRSETVQIRLVAMGRTETGPQQEIAARLADGVLRGEVRAAGEQPSRFELRREGAQRDERAADETIREQMVRDEPVRDETVREEPVRDESVRRDDARGSSKATGTAYPTLVVQRREIVDPGLGGVPSHTIGVPEGWQFTGGPVWTGNPDTLVTFVGELRAPDDASLHFLREQQFRYSRSQTQQGVFDDTRGQTFPDGAVARHAPKQPGEVATEVILPQLRPGATDVRVVGAERLPKLEEALRTLLQPQLDMIESLQAQARNNQMPGMRTDANTWLVVERSRVRYTEQGTEWEEEVQCSLIGSHGTVASELVRSENGAWTLANVRTARAKANQLDSRLGALWLCGDSVRETPRWSAAVAQIKLEVAKAKTAAMRADLQEIIRRGEQAAKTRTELSDAQMASWRSQQDSYDRVQKARIDALGERQDFRSTDGNTWTVTNHYDRAFKNADDSIILTNDPNYRPAGDARVNQKTWEEMRRIDPFGR